MEAGAPISAAGEATTRGLLPAVPPIRVGVAGGAVVGAAFGMARYAYGLTLPDVRRDLHLSEVVLGAIASATLIGFLVALLLSGPLSAWRGPRAPTTIGGLSGMTGAVVVALAHTPLLMAVGATLAGSAAGWVWAPYSEIVPAMVSEAFRDGLLTAISTGTSAGLVTMGLLASLTPRADWRVIWCGVAVCTAGAALVNVVWIPRLPPRIRAPAVAGTRLARSSAIAPLVFAGIYFAACTAYFTYASDAAARSGLGNAAGPVMYITIGVAGLSAVILTPLTGRVGPQRAAAGCACIVAAALIVLAAVSHSSIGVLMSAAVFGVGYMTGSAVLVLWSTAVFPDQPANGFTLTLIAGTICSIATPLLIGAFRTQIGLIAVLSIFAALTATAAAALWFHATP